jgi:transposase
MVCCPDGKSYRRLNAIHLLLIGVAYDLVLRNCGRSERCLRLWISRFNEQGIDGLTYRPQSGRPRKLTAADIESQILPVVDDLTLAGQLHWTAVKLCGWLRQEKPFDISYRTLVRYLHEHNYARRIPRPVPEPPDPDQWALKREACATELASLLADPTARVFFGDEADFEGDPRPRHRWVKRGSRPTQGYHGGHLRRNIVGAVEPATGQLVSLIVAHCNRFPALVPHPVDTATPGMDMHPSSPRTELDLITEQELALHLKICRRQLYNWRVSGLIPYFKMGKAVRFRVADVAAAIERMRVG